MKTTIEEVIQSLNDQITLRRMWLNIALGAQAIKESEPIKAEALVKTLEEVTDRKITL